MKRCCESAKRRKKVAAGPETKAKTKTSPILDGRAGGAARTLACRVVLSGGSSLPRLGMHFSVHLSRKRNNLPRVTKQNAKKTTHALFHVEQVVVVVVIWHFR